MQSWWETIGLTNDLSSKGIDDKDNKGKQPYEVIESKRWEAYGKMFSWKMTCLETKSDFVWRL
jgi:hypothetical protein